jgi:hypothetical protein
VRPGGAEHQWRKIPPDPVAMQFDFEAERFGEPFKRLLWTLRDLLLMWFGRRHCHDIRPSYAYGFEAVPGAPLQARARHRGYQLATICRPTPRLPPITTMVLPANGSILFSWNRCLHIRFMGGTAMGSIRRECTDHLLVFNAEHLRRILAKYASYYNEVRTHVALGKDTPCRRPIEQFGDIVAYPILGGLHHQYARI